MSKTPKINGILVNPFADDMIGFYKKVAIADDIDSFYKSLHCDLIDIIHRQINGHDVCIVCDDEGLLKPENKIALIINHPPYPDPEIIVGRIFITGIEDDEGNLTSLPLEAYWPIALTISLSSETGQFALVTTDPN